MSLPQTSEGLHADLYLRSATKTQVRNFSDSDDPMRKWIRYGHGTAVDARQPSGRAVAEAKRRLVESYMPPLNSVRTPLFADPVNIGTEVGQLHLVISNVGTGTCDAYATASDLGADPQFTDLVVQYALSLRTEELRNLFHGRVVHPTRTASIGYLVPDFAPEEGVGLESDHDAMEALRSRIAVIEQDWAEEEPAIVGSKDSLSALRDLLAKVAAWPRPRIFGTGGGLFRAEWFLDPSHHLAITFLEIDRVQVTVLSQLNGQRIQAIKQLRTADAVAWIDAQGVREWIGRVQSPSS